MITTIRRVMTGRLADSTGSATAEYAIVTMAAVAFAGLLVSLCQHSVSVAFIVRL